jgi:hypothetical protein
VNVPSVVLAAAGLSVIARGGITPPGIEHHGTSPYVFKFWAGIIGVALGLIVLEKWNPNLAKNLAAVWLVGGTIGASTKIVPWLRGYSEGLKK